MISIKAPGLDVLVTLVLGSKGSTVQAISLPSQRGYHSGFWFLLQFLEPPAKQYINRSLQD